MRPRDYLHLQMRLEGMEVVGEFMLRQVEAVPGELLPLLLVAQLADGDLVVYHNEAAAPELAMKLRAQVPESAFPDIDPLTQTLKSHTIKFEVGHYQTCVFQSPPAIAADVICLSKEDPSIQAFGFDRFAEHVFAVMKNGVVASACVSAREDAQCGEAWVYTAHEYRHQGLAQNVVAAWGRSLIDAGKVPFYSHKIENTASASLAAKLGLQPVFEEITFTPTD